MIVFTIDVVEVVNGYRLDIMDKDGNGKHENVETYLEVLSILTHWIAKKAILEERKLRGTT